jgi:hypothetical protein
MRRMAMRSSPARIDHPFCVVKTSREIAQVEAKGRRRRVAARQYDLIVPYRNMYGRVRSAKARLLVPEGARDPMPLVVALHYETGFAGAAEYLAEGWAVMTPRGALNPFGEGVNLNLALLSACRLMPFVDQQRVALTGSSAGGYMTLMAASQAFPIAAAAAVVPLVSIPYQIEYYAKNIGPARCRAKDEKGNDVSRVPVFCQVAEMVKGFAAFLEPLEKDWRTWLRNCPNGVMDFVTCPTLATFSTADVLVPINQVGDGFVRRAPTGAFPDGFEFDRRALVAPPGARKAFMEAVGRRVRVFNIKIPENLTPFWEEEKPGNQAAAHDIPCVFSKRAPFSVVILDEGPPDPRIGHFKYRFAYSILPFFRHWFGKKIPLAVEQLTAGKLALLMRRFRGEDFERLRGYEQGGKALVPLTRRNRPSKEKADVIIGLRAYAESSAAHQEHLRDLYRRLPAALRALDLRGARFDEDVIGGLAFHEARLHCRWGDRARARALARRLLRDPKHRAYAACLPAGLRGRAPG